MARSSPTHVSAHGAFPIASFSASPTLTCRNYRGKTSKGFLCSLISSTRKSRLVDFLTKTRRDECKRRANPPKRNEQLEIVGWGVGSSDACGVGVDDTIQVRGNALWFADC